MAGKVLIIDDSAYARHRLKALLSHAGYTVAEAEGGRVALEMLDAVDPDLITVDLLMPDMDGLEVIRRLRARRPSVPILTYSADVQRATQEQAFAAGASRFLSKTEPTDKVLEAVCELIGPADLTTLSDLQLDAFTELMNIAMGQAAQALSVLLERPCLLKVPKVEVMTTAGLRAFFECQVPAVGTLVQQRFSGPLEGVAALVLPPIHALLLVRTLWGGESELARLSPTEQSVLSEAGNIILNAALATLGNQLQVRLQVGIPQMSVNLSGPTAVSSLLRLLPGAAWAVVFLSSLTISDTELITYLILIMPQADVARLLTRLTR